MESGGGAPPAGAVGAAAEPPQCPLPPVGEGVAGPPGPPEPEGAAEGAGVGGEGAGGGGPRRALRAVYVRSESPRGGAAGGPEAGARQCLLRACEAEGAHLISVPFGELDFGETAVLDAFYDAGEAGSPLSPTPLLPTFLSTRAARAPAPPYPSTPCQDRPTFWGGESRGHCTLLRIRKQRPLAFIFLYSSVFLNIS